jgi:hypothetical protein
MIAPCRIKPSKTAGRERGKAKQPMRANKAKAKPCWALSQNSKACGKDDPGIKPRSVTKTKPAQKLKLKAGLSKEFGLGKATGLAKS